VYLDKTKRDREFYGSPLRKDLLAVLIPPNILYQEGIEGINDKCFVAVPNNIKVHRDPIKPKRQEGINAVDWDHHQNPDRVLLEFGPCVVYQVFVYQVE